MKYRNLTAGVLSCLMIAGCSSSSSDDDGFENDLSLLQQVLTTNADIAFASYSDSVTTAQALRAALVAFEAAPTVAANLEAAKQAWLVAREPYGQTEVYRFRNSPIDDDPDTPAAEDGPEGSLNAWPLGEALIDYVQATTTDFGDGEVGVTTSSTTVQAGGAITAAFANANPTQNIISQTGITIDSALLDGSASAADEHDVISGYHAIEFLLWGQDLDNAGTQTDGTDRADAIKVHDAGMRATGGERPLSDFDTSGGACTSAGAIVADAICQRRHDYLLVAVDKLIAELIFVRDHWDPAMAGNYREDFVNPANLAEAEGRVLEILTGMGTMSEGELAGERMQISLSANSQEDEHSCFSDNTHRDVVLNALGVANMFYGEYAGYDSDLDGTVDAGTAPATNYGIDNYLGDVGLTTLRDSVAAALTTTETNYNAMDTAARANLPVDVVIQDAFGVNAQAMRDTVVSLNAQSSEIADIAIELGLGNADDVVDPDASDCDTTDPTSTC
ncbi:MAG: imelysin family protein [Pseudomonadota bacterium]